MTHQSGWILPQKGGATINGRWYTEHALERMAPNTPEVVAFLETRALQRAKVAGDEFQTRAFGVWWSKNRPIPRGIPSSIVEAEIAQPGTTGVRVILNECKDVITVIPGEI
ncbi:MAG: hypothetical protein Q8K75_03810 [Chlamydiales bacterium]|nr:hypothetical protein [Chlamydiales bacterium]